MSRCGVEIVLFSAKAANSLEFNGGSLSDCICFDMPWWAKISLVFRGWFYCCRKHYFHFRVSGSRIHNNQIVVTIKVGSSKAHRNLTPWFLLMVWCAPVYGLAWWLGNHSKVPPVGRSFHSYQETSILLGAFGSSSLYEDVLPCVRTW